MLSLLHSLTAVSVTPFASLQLSTDIHNPAQLASDTPKSFEELELDEPKTLDEVVLID